MAKKKAARKPIAPPPGTYDPNLDAQERASGRGLGDLILDTGQQRTRNYDDLQLGLGQIGTSRTRNQQDYNTAVSGEKTAYGRSLADLLQGRARQGEDYQTSLSDLSRQYQQLGDVQLQAANKAGVLGGGATAQAARKRAANQVIDKAPIDTAYNRYLTDSNTQQTRLGEDDKTTLAGLLTQFTRGNEDLDVQQGQLGLSYKRGDDDLTTQLARGQRENTEFGQDVAAARQAQYGGPLLMSGPAQTGGQQHPSVTSIAAGPGIPGTKKVKKGRTVTYTSSVGRP